MAEDWEQYCVDQQVVWMPIEDIKPYDHNVKLHDNMLGYLKNNIRKVKFRTPIYVDRDHVIIAGHARRLAALALGMKKVPVIVADDLSEEDVKLWRLTDNRLTELSDYDLDALGLEVQGLRDLGVQVEDFGLDFDFGDPLAGWGDEFDDEDDTEGGIVGSFEHDGDARVVESGDIVRMGEHRLICRDPTDLVPALEDAGVADADISIVALPYAVQGRDYPDYLNGMVESLLLASHEAFLVFPLTAVTKGALTDVLSLHGDSLKDLAYWVRTKVDEPPVRDVIASAVEPILCMGRDGSRSFRHKREGWDGVIEANGPKKAKEHALAVPMDVPSDIIATFTEEHDTVLCCYAGRGDALMACDESSRVCVCVEPDPERCDAVVRRYIESTGADDVVVVRHGREILFSGE